jgi:hypothetical protein
MEELALQCERAKRAEDATASMVPIEDVKPLLDLMMEENRFQRHVKTFLAKHGDKLK